MNKRFGLGGIVLLLALSHCALAKGIEIKTIKWDRPKYTLNIQYPQGLLPPNLNTVVEKLIFTTKKEFIEGLADEADLPPNIPGKSGLTITYTIPYQVAPATSIQFNISTFNKGSAHPANTITLLNFLADKPVQLKDLFKPKAKFLQKLSIFCRGKLMDNKDFEMKWLTEGTEPSEKNYSRWYFTAQGLAIVFDTYQVAAYVYGPQVVELPLEEFDKMLKPEVLKAVWGTE